mgnify:FL=1
MLRDLAGYCLMKYGQEGQQTTTQTPQPPLQAPPQMQSPPPPQMQSPPSVDANGQCCPQPNPITINVTNSQDTNSRNVNSSMRPRTNRRPQPKAASLPPPAPPQITRQIVYMPRYYPRYQRLIQPVPVPVVKKVVQRVEVPVNRYIDRIVEIPEKDVYYPAYY